MDEFTKLLLFLGQQLYLYKRRVIFVEELRQIFASDKEVEDALKEPLKQGWIRPVGDEHHFEITEIAEANVLRHWNKNVYKTGEVGGGSIKGNPNDHRFTLIVEF